MESEPAGTLQIPLAPYLNNFCRPPYRLMATRSEYQGLDILASAFSLLPVEIEKRRKNGAFCETALARGNKSHECITARSKKKMGHECTRIYPLTDLPSKLFGLFPIG